MITNAQIEQRKLGVGGSDMAIIMGLSNYKTPYQLYLEKVGESEPTEMTEYQYWGQQLEPVVLAEFEKRNNIRVKLVDTLIHPKYDFLRANIDGFIPDLNAVLEIKCSNQFMSQNWGDEGSDVIPMPYLVQVAHYCLVTNADCAYIAVLIGGNQYRQFKYTRDAELEGLVLEAARNFWQQVTERRAPEPINQSDLKMLFPYHREKKAVTIDNMVAEQLTTLTKIRCNIKQLSDDEERHKFNIMHFMADAEYLVNSAGKPIVSWKANKRGVRTFLLKGNMSAEGGLNA